MKQSNSDWETRLRKRPGAPGLNEAMKQRIREKIAMGQKRKHLGLKLGAVAMLLLALVAGVYSQKDDITRWASALWAKDEQKLAPMEDNVEYQLKVGYFHKDTFMNNYGRYFMIQHDNTDLEVVSLPQTADVNELKKWMEQEPWDVLYLPFMFYQQLAPEGYFYALEGVVSQSPEAFTGITDNVLDTLRHYGGGQLYGMTPNFQQYALFYNKQLFDAHQVTYPQSGMNWQEVFQLADRFAHPDQVGEPPYGLFSSGQSPFRLVYDVGMTEQLQIADQQGNFTLRTEGWQRVWDMVLAGYRNGSVYPNWELPSSAGRYMSDIYKDHPFLRGEAAMMVGSYSLISDIEQAFNKYGMEAFEWGVTTEPRNPQTLEKSHSFALEEVIVINARSEQVSAAWELVKMINSLQMAQRKMQQSDNFRLPLYPQLVEDAGQVDAAVFYEGQPDFLKMDNTYEQMMQLWMMQAQGDVYFQSILNGDLELSDTLAVWELELQQQALEMEDKVNE